MLRFAPRPLVLVGAVALGTACSGQISPLPEAGNSATPPVVQRPPNMPGPPGLDPPAMPPAAPVSTSRFSRLSHTQWENAVRDLLRLDKLTNLSNTFIRDPIAGFENSGDILEVSVELRGDYERAAEALADAVASDPAKLAKVAPAAADAAARRDLFVRELGRRAYRRPLEAAEVDELTKLFALGPEASSIADPFAAGAALVIRAVLQSPFFLYRTELSTQAENGRVALSDWEVATKLAFALTNTMPDDALFTSAAGSTLRTRDGVRKEAMRLLGSPAALTVVDNFTLQLFQVPKYAGISPKDKTMYPQWDAIKGQVPRDAERETLLFGREIFNKDLGVRELFSAPFSFVNARLASLYGLTGTFEPDNFVRADLNPNERGGVLTQIGFLATRAGSTQPDPIHRGLFVIEHVICGSVPPPIPNVTPPAAMAGKTNRQLWEAQTHQGACASCHRDLINPMGFAFEGFDAIGKVRREDAGLPVDTSGFFRFPQSGEKRFAGAVELGKVLAETPEVHACFARNWLSYVHGRAPQSGDEAEIKALAERLGKERLSVRNLLLALVTSDTFLTRLP